MSLTRHFTATGFVVHDKGVLLHWHMKVGAWLPPGGHIEENEDPVQAVLREVREETGVQAEVVPTGGSLGLDYPVQVESPFTIMVEDIHDPVLGYHQHIDMIYLCRLVGPPGPLNDGWIWVDESDLADGTPLVGGDVTPVPPPDDVKLLALRAISDIHGHSDLG